MHSAAECLMRRGKKWKADNVWKECRNALHWLYFGKSTLQSKDINVMRNRSALGGYSLQEDHSYTPSYFVCLWRSYIWLFSTDSESLRKNKQTVGRGKLLASLLLHLWLYLLEDKFVLFTDTVDLSQYLMLDSLNYSWKKLTWDNGWNLPYR